VQIVEKFDIYKNTGVYDRIWHVCNLFELQDKKNILKVILSVHLTFIDNILHTHYLLMNFAVLRLNTVGITGDTSRVKDLKVALVRRKADGCDVSGSKHSVRHEVERSPLNWDRVRRVSFSSAAPTYRNSTTPENSRKDPASHR
jgi:hypothetical protein